MRKMLIPTLLFSLLWLPLPVRAVEPGSPAPDFSLKTTKGENVHLSDFKGRPIILKLATTWCPTCKQQSQEFKAAAAFLKDHNVAIVEVFLQDSEQMVRDYFLGQENLPEAVILDDGTALKAYNVYLIPRVILIDQEFKVRRDGSLIPAKDLIFELEKFVGAPGKKAQGS